MDDVAKLAEDAGRHGCGSGHDSADLDRVRLSECVACRWLERVPHSGPGPGRQPRHLVRGELDERIDHRTVRHGYHQGRQDRQVQVARQRRQRNRRPIAHRPERRRLPSLTCRCHPRSRPGQCRVGDLPDRWHRQSGELPVAVSACLGRPRGRRRQRRPEQRRQPRQSPRWQIPRLGDGPQLQDRWRSLRSAQCRALLRQRRSRRELHRPHEPAAEEDGNGSYSRLQRQRLDQRPVGRSDRDAVDMCRRSDRCAMRGCRSER